MSAPIPPDQRPGVETLFVQALDLPSTERAAFLDGACRDDPVLRQRVQTLLAAHERADDLFATAPESVQSTVKLDLPDRSADDAVGLTLGRQQDHRLDQRLGQRTAPAHLAGARLGANQAGGSAG